MGTGLRRTGKGADALKKLSDFFFFYNRVKYVVKSCVGATLLISFVLIPGLNLNLRRGQQQAGVYILQNNMVGLGRGGD